MRRGIKYTLIVFAGLLLLLALLMLLTQTAFFKEQVKTKIITVAEKQLNAKIGIEKIDGNFYSNLTIENLQLSQNDSLLARFPSIYLEYNLWDLTGRIISVDSVIINQPHVNLFQKNDSTWNVNSIAKSKNKKTPQTKKLFNFEIQAKHLSIKEGSISISALSKIIPQKTSNINLDVNGSYSKNETKVRLQKFSFITENPSLVLNNISGLFQKNNNGIQVDSLLIISNGSNINLDGKYASKDNLNADIDASRIDNKELAIFIPKFKLLCSPALNTTLVTKNDSVTAVAKLYHNNQSLEANISFGTLSNLLSKKENVPYLAKLSFNNFIVENWIDTKNRHALINGNVDLQGADLLNMNSNMNINANLAQSQYIDVAFDTLSLNGVYNNDSLTALLDVQSDYGKIKVDGTLYNISGTPGYKAQITSDNFNLTAFVPKAKGTKINGLISAKGTGFEKNNLYANTTIRLNQSSVYEFPIDSLQASVSLNQSNLDIDSIQVEVPGAKAKGSGNLNLDSLILESSIYADIRSTKVIDSLIILPIEFDSVTTLTSITGPLSDLKIGGDVEIYNAQGYSVETEKANAKYMVSTQKDSIVVNVSATALSVKTGPAFWDTTIVDFNYNKHGMDIDANVIWKDTVNAIISSHITVGDTLDFEVSKFEAQTLLADYYLTDTMHTRLINTETVEINNFRIKDYNLDEFLLSANGKISAIDTNKFNVEINEFDLQQLNRLLSIPDSLKGVLKTKIELSGKAQNPSMVGSMTINNPQYGKYSLSELSSNFNYINKNGFADITTADLGKSFYGSINTSFNTYIDSLKLMFNPPDTFNASVVVDSLEISRFTNRLIHSDSIRGLLNGKVMAKGEFDNPQFFGEIDLTNGHIEDNDLGIDYNNIHTSVVFNGNKIIMDTVLVKQKDGLLSIVGDVEFDSTMIKGNIKSSSLQMDAKNFFVTRHRNYELLIDANSFIRTDNEHPEFGGNIKVIRSDVYLPSLMPDSKTNIETDVPLLLQAIQKTQDSVFSEEEARINSKLENKKNSLYENLTGRLNVEIPRNTWIKNDDMRLELSGDLEIVKTGPYFEIFGNIDVIRGQYILYGKKLNVEESQIIFQGGEELDPTININAEYIYRSSDKEKRYLDLIISGKVSEPDITFLLDDAEISETDGISVLVFGATSDEIGYGTQNGMVSSIGSNAVASVITSQLSRTIGTQLKLDMIEITSTENWQSAAFVVGKYITNDIFVTYQRGFGEVEDDEITPENITVEYEINDKLFLRLESGSSKTSGIDIILKFEQEKEKIVPTTIREQENIK